MKSQLNAMTSLKSPVKAVRDPIADKSKTMHAPKMNLNTNEGSKKEIEEKMNKKDTLMTPGEMASPNRSQKRIETLPKANEKKTKEPVQPVVKGNKAKPVSGNNATNATKMPIAGVNNVEKNSNMMPSEESSSSAQITNENENNSNMMMNTENETMKTEMNAQEMKD